MMHFARESYILFRLRLTLCYTCEHYSCPYETIRNIARAFEENGQLLPKHIGGVCYQVLQHEHIQWLVKRLDANKDVIIETDPSSAKWFFNSHAMYLSFVCSKAIQSQVGLTLKLMHYQVDDNNNDKHLREHIEWCPKEKKIRAQW